MYFIAIDSGGTKTDAVLFDEKGHLWGRSKTMGCNAMDIGIAEACRHLLSVLLELKEKIPEGGELKAVYSGVAATDYFGGQLGTYVRPHFPGVTMRFEDDAVNLISGTLGHKNGCAIIGGTGSSLYARIDGKIIHLGGWGYLIDTGGSGYALGRDAFLAAFRYCDGRGKKTLIYDMLWEQMGSRPEENIPRIYQGGRSYIASFAGTVFQARREGDAIAEEIFQKGVHALAELTFAAETYFQGPYEGIMGGGIFSNFPEYSQALQRVASPLAHLVLSEQPPILGGVIEALCDGGVEPTDQICRCFLQEYREGPEEV